MTIKWSNIIAFILILLAFYLLITWQDDLTLFFSKMIKVSSLDGKKNDPLFGMMAFAMIGWLIVAIVKITKQ